VGELTLLAIEDIGELGEELASQKSGVSELGGGVRV